MTGDGAAFITRQLRAAAVDDRCFIVVPSAWRALASLYLSAATSSSRRNLRDLRGVDSVPSNEPFVSCPLMRGTWLPTRHRWVFVVGEAYRRRASVGLGLGCGNDDHRPDDVRLRRDGGRSAVAGDADVAFELPKPSRAAARERRPRGDLEDVF